MRKGEMQNETQEIVRRKGSYSNDCERPPDDGYIQYKRLDPYEQDRKSNSVA